VPGLWQSGVTNILVDEPWPCSAAHDFVDLASADQVYTEIKRRAKDALLMLIEKEREGEQVNS
jgi:hypothetical protein